MTRVRPRGEDVRKFILASVIDHPRDIARVTAEHFGTTRQAVGLHLGKLVREKALDASGVTRSRVYKLRPQERWETTYATGAKLEEFDVWQADIRGVLGHLPGNVLDIWHYGFTEMFNNAIDHSGAKTISVVITKTAATTELMIHDDGVGIFEKIQAALGLADARHAVLELAKGKLTTDPSRHTGEGIFFTSRMFDKFDIMSEGVFYTHEFGVDEDWILERDKPRKDGTTVWMVLNNHTARDFKKIFEQYSSGEDREFSRTVVPVKLARYGKDQLISRSQAKRVISRVDRFKTVILDFKDVSEIGPAFADEIFRVFALMHPEMDLTGINMSEEVHAMVRRAMAAKRETQRSMPENKADPTG
jgi:hypothetical protein